MRQVRLVGAWLLVVPFLWLAEPTPVLLAAGAVLAALGLAVRAWSAGVITKEKELAVGGPYAYTRNPLYVGSFLLGLGVALAGGKWYFVAVFLLFYAVIYGRTIGGEAALLERLFGDRYRHYAERVPLVVPRLTPYRPPEGAPPSSFTFSQWRRNREYEAGLGALAGFAFLAAKMWWMP